MAQNFNSVSEFTKNISRGTFGISLITLTEPKMRKTNNPYFGRVHKASYMANVALGYDYENSVNNRLDKKAWKLIFKPKNQRENLGLNTHISYKPTKTQVLNI